MTDAAPAPLPNPNPHHTPAPGASTAPAPSAVERAGTWAVAAAPVAAVGIAQIWTPSDSPATAICPFRRVTGGWCPFCGLTRASVHLLRGDVGDAVAYHPLVIPALLAAFAVWLIVLERRADLTRWRVPPIPRRLVTPTAVVLVVVFVAVWIARLAENDIPRPFA